MLGWGPWPGQSSWESWDSPRARDPRGAAQVTSQHVLGQGQFFGDLVPHMLLVPRLFQQRHTFVAPSPRITLFLHTCLQKVHTQCEVIALMIIKYSHYKVKQWLNLKSPQCTKKKKGKKEDNKAPNAFLVLSLSIGHLDSVAGKDALS